MLRSRYSCESQYERLALQPSHGQKHKFDAGNCLTGIQMHRPVQSYPICAHACDMGLPLPLKTGYAAQVSKLQKFLNWGIEGAARRINLSRLVDDSKCYLT